MSTGPSPEVQAFLRAIKADPGDDTHRLVLGDWLQENGLTEAERARGEFFYLQCRFARLPEGDPQRLATRDRLHALRGEHERAWVGPWWAWAEWWTFRRGLLRPAVCGLQKLGRGGLSDPAAWLWVDALRVFPLASVEILPLTRSPCLAQLNRLNLKSNRLGTLLARALATCHHLTALTHLDLCHTDLGDDGARILADSPHLASLTHLNLRYNKVGDEGARALAGSPHLNRLAFLCVDSNNISDGSLRRIEERFGKIVGGGILDW